MSRAAAPPMLTVTAWTKPAVTLTPDEIERKLEQTLKRLHDCEETLSVERRKRRALEQQVLLDGSVQAGSSRRLKVTVSLAVIGCVFLSISVPVCVFQLFGLGNIEVDYGYAVSASTLGCAIFLAGTTPADHTLVRFMAGFFAEVVLTYVVISTLLFSLWTVDDFCLYSETSCASVYIGAMAIVPVLSTQLVAWAWTLRLIPGSDRVPLTRLWQHHKAKMGRVPAAAFIAAVPLSAWAIAQPEELLCTIPARLAPSHLVLVSARQFHMGHHLRSRGCSWLRAGRARSGARISGVVFRHLVAHRRRPHCHQTRARA